MESIVQTRQSNFGRAELIARLKGCGLSRRRAKRILNFVFEEMKHALARNEPVEFPPGWLVREKRISRHWELIRDEPMKPYTVEFREDEADALFGIPGQRLSKRQQRKLGSPRPRGRPKKKPEAETTR